MTTRPELFRNQSDEHFQVNQAGYETGVNALSDYTLHEMPGDLSQVRDKANPFSFEDLAAKQQDVLEAGAMAVLSNHEEEVARIAQLDMLFMLGGYLPAGDTALDRAPGTLHALLDHNAERFGLPKRMDYEMIVDVNTKRYQTTGNIRLFSEGVQADAERDFYIGHYYSEPHMKLAAFQLRTLLERPDASDPNKATTLASARDHIDAFGGSVRDYGKLAVAHFGHFRPFLGEYPDGTRNASGAFMPSPQLAEMTLHEPTDQYDLFLTEAKPYYPKWSQPLITEWARQSHEGHNIRDAIIDGRLKLNDEQLDLLGEVVTALYRTKQAHLGTTYRQIPQAFPERGKGL
jgi:hypothetical protein